MAYEIDLTARKPLTKKQKAELFLAHKGTCYLCGDKITGKWRDEHVRALALLGTNDLSNRAPVHYHCARAKDKQDIARISKSKQQRDKCVIGAERIGMKPKSAKPKKKIPSRPFPKTQRKFGQ